MKEMTYEQAMLIVERADNLDELYNTMEYLKTIDSIENRRDVMFALYYKIDEYEDMK